MAGKEDMTPEERGKFEANDAIWVSSVNSFQSLMKVVSHYMDESMKASKFLYEMEQKYGVKRTHIPPPPTKSIFGENKKKKK
jgi:hypothetical protein